MPKVQNRELAAFHCTNCDVRLGWTAPGEAEKMASRAAMYCDECKDGPARLTERQEEVITVAGHLRSEAGRAPTLAEIGAAMLPPLSASRVQSLAASIRMRGHRERLDTALYSGTPEPVQAGTTVAVRESSKPTPLEALDHAREANLPGWGDVQF